MDTSTSDALFTRAVRLIPGGVNSPVRAFGSVGGTPRFIARASGVTLTDADGNDSIAIRPMCVLGLSWDHRALDGVAAARFLAEVRDRMR